MPRRSSYMTGAMSSAALVLALLVLHVAAQTASPVPTTTAVPTPDGGDLKETYTLTCPERCFLFKVFATSQSQYALDCDSFCAAVASADGVLTGSAASLVSGVAATLEQYQANALNVSNTARAANTTLYAAAVSNATLGVLIDTIANASASYLAEANRFSAYIALAGTQANWNALFTALSPVVFDWATFQAYWADNSTQLTPLNFNDKLTDLTAVIQQTQVSLDAVYAALVQGNAPRTSRVLYARYVSFQYVASYTLRNAWRFAIAARAKFSTTNETRAATLANFVAWQSAQYAFTIQQASTFSVALIVNPVFVDTLALVNAITGPRGGNGGLGKATLLLSCEDRCVLARAFSAAAADFSLDCVAFCNEIRRSGGALTAASYAVLERARSQLRDIQGQVLTTSTVTVALRAALEQAGTTTQLQRLMQQVTENTQLFSANVSAALDFANIQPVRVIWNDLFVRLELDPVSVFDQWNTFKAAWSNFTTFDLLEYVENSERFNETIQDMLQLKVQIDAALVSHVQLHSDRLFLVRYLRMHLAWSQALVYAYQYVVAGRAAFDNANVTIRDYVSAEFKYAQLDVYKRFIQSNNVTTFAPIEANVLEGTYSALVSFSDVFKDSGNGGHVAHPVALLVALLCALGSVASGWLST
ncbi:hypothetical protein CAOG_03404 [Capsaspora owczarzaki ATCC 30864]|uniref:Uncharacterized protein n=1 Tax=Capsaspora owczarzaki (strain ATCC 30864) TaxID=595528 RepID=A0A0D2WP85_CAPO3|nr:hypothetical protein CAOG_03404 [Capsaspora owczarzaki ATCC 30864]KJE92428.1 hypothetical protein CAOG_003404 [Capsaspora owczarzaki ATCC 30864]|eukprot:XP_004364243.2 hypothetical protein CAOG_03404 [Capsaspora owczarzaki ATCC 30864]